MTFLGKILVLLNTAFSFGMLAWSLTLYHNRVDWSDNKAQGEQPPGELTKRRVEIDDAWATVAPAEAAWREPRQAIAAMEKQRPLDRVWYAAQLEHLRTGASAADPARAIVYEKGLPALDPMNFNRPRMAAVTDRKGQPLQKYSYYENELNASRDVLVMELKKHQDLVKEDERLTRLLVGEVNAAKVVTAKGLRQRLIDERVKQQELREEDKVVRPVLINAMVESQVVLSRAESLKARIDELQRLLPNGVAG